MSQLLQFFAGQQRYDKLLRQAVTAGSVLAANGLGSYFPLSEGTAKYIRRLLNVE